MTCRDLVSFLMAYLAHELPANVRETFERHLDRCANCREFLHQYRVTLAVSQAAVETADARIPDDLATAIAASIAAERTDTRD